MNFKKPLSLIITAVMLTAAITISSLSARNPKPAVKTTAVTASQPATADEAPDGMRGIWVTYMELSMENEAEKSEAAFRQKFAGIAAMCKNTGFNTLIVQVRPFCDALYDSKLFPPSHILSGEQGKSAGYDALKIMCAITHKLGMKLHAWVNPYRVTANQTPQKLSGDNPYIKDKSLGLALESGIILNPANEAARKLITEGVTELAENYDIDGVQFDDYFYPEDVGDSDSADYQAYLESAPENGAMDLQTWRESNVNLLVAETYLAVHRAKPKAVFGISPQGNLGNNKLLCADVINWCGKRGFVDYICPQLYFSLDNPALGFEQALSQWSELEFSDSVRLYVGLAGYKAGTDADEGTWLGRDSVLADELNILKKNQKVQGFVLYSVSSLSDKDAAKEMQNLKSAMPD